MNFAQRTSATPDSIRKKKRIIALRNKYKDMSTADIAVRIGCSRQYVEQVLKKYGPNGKNHETK